MYTYLSLSLSRSLFVLILLCIHVFLCFWRLPTATTTAPKAVVLTIVMLPSAVFAASWRGYSETGLCKVVAAENLCRATAPAPRRYPSSDPKYHETETVRPFLEARWGGGGCTVGASTLTNIMAYYSKYTCSILYYASK